MDPTCGRWQITIPSSSFVRFFQQQCKKITRLYQIQVLTSNEKQKSCLFFVWIVHSSLTSSLPTVLLHHDRRHNGFGASVATATGWLFRPRTSDKAVHSSKGPAISHSCVWEDVFCSYQRRKRTNRKTSSLSIDGGVFKLQGAESSQNFFCAQFHVWELWSRVGELRSNRGSLYGLERCPWVAGPLQQIEVPTWMKMPPTLQMFVPKWKQMASILNW